MKLDIGRNDSCPCGSGKKFKKCCIDNPLNLFPRHVPERKQHWYRDEIEELPTAKIVEKLAMCGIPFSRDEFLIDVNNHHSSDDIYKEWKTRYTITATGFDEDFPWMAAEVLWRRLAPDKVSTMQLDDMVQDGYELTGGETTTKGCDLWLRVWDILKTRFTKDMRKIEDADKVIFQSQFLSNWLQDMELELVNAAIEDPKYHSLRIQFCREVIEYFPEGNAGSDILPQMKRAIAESTFMSGKREEGERLFQDVIKEYPSDPWGYIVLGDMYHGAWVDPDGNGDGDGEDGFKADNVKAEECYRKALGKEPEVDKMIQDRLRDLKVVGLLKPLKTVKA